MTPRKATVPPIGCICRDLNCTIPFGFCHCGCGANTPIAIRSNSFRGHIIRRPIPYINGHNVKDANPMGELADAAPFKIEGVYCRLIPLSKGLYAIVWDEDFERLSKFKWYAQKLVSHRSDHCAARYGPMVNGERKLIYMHREVLNLGTDNPLMADHINHNTLDNRRSNLRPANDYQNQQNMVLSKRNTSGYKGVIFSNRPNRIKKWYALIYVNGKSKRLGYYHTKEEAYTAYCNAALLYFGEFARLV